MDELNEPWLLNREPWLCAGWHCREDSEVAHGKGRQRARQLHVRQTSAGRDINEGGRGRTVETEGGGLGVVKAASDFMRRNFER